MPDALGWRAKFGVLAPSTNTIVEPDFYHIQVPGVTAHFSRIHIQDQDLSSESTSVPRASSSGPWQPETAGGGVKGRVCSRGSCQREHGSPSWTVVN